MNGEPVHILFGDANILIDLHEAGGLDAIALLIKHRLATIRIPKLVCDEVTRHLDLETIASLGMEIVPLAGVDELRQANAIADARLSLTDKLLFVQAQACNGAVWTNDRRLGEHCRKSGISVYRILAPIKWLVERRLLSQQDFNILVQSLESVNPYLVGRLSEG